MPLDVILLVQRTRATARARKSLGDEGGGLLGVMAALEAAGGGAPVWRRAREIEAVVDSTQALA